MKKGITACLMALMALGGSAVLVQAGNNPEAKTLQLSQVPPAVQKVIKQEAVKHPLVSLAMGDDGGAEVYEGKFRGRLQQIELKIAADGRVVSRELERNHREDREEMDD
ncbi:MAG: hypothetical protein KKC30_05295 [Proteobacteria bacterium]|nr:hypothetical protein [Pseudomonadota bacterium]MBU4384761.1 hypothetical protein [Pseudomonadota bacterium]MCG2764071.1 hypothetical protein [Desulfarculaceae bacterium]